MLVASKLQVALDLISFGKAIKVALYAIKGGVDIIEAGTPLLEKYGVNFAIRELRAISGDLPIVADLKIADAGDISAEIAFSAGADIITVLGVASKETIRKAVNVARKYGGKVAVDLINSMDPRYDIEKAISTGANYIIAHTGLDMQSKGFSALDAISKISELIKPEMLCVAGGININNIDLILEFNPAVIIVGGAITKARDPFKATKELKEKINIFHH